MNAWYHSATDVLRRAAWTQDAASGWRSTLRLAGCLCLFGLFYGAVMGTFRLIEGEEIWFRQIVYSATKVPLLLALTFIITLPSFFVLNTLLGLRADLHQAVRSVIATQAGLAIILASLAPFTLLWYASSGNYHAALLFNTAMFATASLSAQWLLRAYYRPLIARDARHLMMLRLWVIVYAVVGIQMGWLLRPFIGSPGSEIQFLRPEAWDNAYVIVAKMVWTTVFGG